MPDSETMLPLEGLTVLDMSQFLAGPAASLRLADLGARVIKIERPGTGELCRQLYLSDCRVGSDSTLFHSVNRNKQSFAANLKDPEDLRKVRELIGQSDVLIQNFRPGVIERLGLGYEDVKQINPRLVYGSITGYGTSGPWRDKPGQDLLAQAVSGLMWLSGMREDGPVPMGLAVADMMAGAYLTQGVLACLVRRGITGNGGHVEISLLEAVLDFQFEVITTYLNDGGQSPQRPGNHPGHAYLAAPYGVYPTDDGYLALAMNPVDKLGVLLDLPTLADYNDSKACFDGRDEVQRMLGEKLRTATTRHWLDILEPADVWCAEVLSWETLLDHEGFKSLDMVQRVQRSDHISLQTLRCPIRIDGQRLTSPDAAPGVGDHTQMVCEEFCLNTRASP